MLKLRRGSAMHPEFRGEAPPSLRESLHSSAQELRQSRLDAAVESWIHQCAYRILPLPAWCPPRFVRRCAGSDKPPACESHASIVPGLEKLGSTSVPSPDASEKHAEKFVPTRRLHN